jgi:hypothetical protein
MSVGRENNVITDRLFGIVAIYFTSFQICFFNITAMIQKKIRYISTHTPSVRRSDRMGSAI